MVAILELLPGVTIVSGDGGASDFALAGTVTPSETTATFAQATFTVYGAAFANPSSTPASAAIEAGTGAVSTASGNAIASLNFTGLTAATAYDFYFVGKDSGGEYTAVTKITATTDAGGDPPPGAFNPAIFIGAGIL